MIGIDFSSVLKCRPSFLSTKISPFARRHQPQNVLQTKYSIREKDVSWDCEVTANRTKVDSAATVVGTKAILTKGTVYV